MIPALNKMCLLELEWPGTRVVVPADSVADTSVKPHTCGPTTKSILVNDFAVNIVNNLNLL